MKFRRRLKFLSSAGYKNAPIVKFEPIFYEMHPLTLFCTHRGQNAPIRILYPFHQLLSKNTAEKDTFSAVFFYPSRRLGISSPQGVYHHCTKCGVYHHRRCIPLRLDDIQNFVLMICNFCEIDDIQGSRLDFEVRMCYNILTR